MASSPAVDGIQLSGTAPSGYENALRHLGRALLGLYFILPGVMKVTGWEGSVSYMATHGVPFVIPLLVLTILLQVGGGFMLAVGYQARATAFVLAGLTLVINLFMHDFWNDYEGLDKAHEVQNFVKNLAIFAGLLYVAGTRPLLASQARVSEDRR